MWAEVPLERIERNPWQTRPVDRGHARTLADDIRANGLLQPPVARILLHGHLVDPALYGGVLPALGDEPEAVVELALGHHRLAAYRLLAAEDGGPEGRWGRMPLDVRQLDSYQMALAAWSENEKRRDVNPLERARAIERMVQDFGWSQAVIAENLGLSRPVVSNSLRLLGLPQKMQEQLAQGALSERQAMALLPLYDLPKGALTRVEKIYSFPRPSEVIEHAGEHASDRIREDVGRILQNATLRLDVVWAGEAFEEQGLKAQRCDECGERMRFEKNMRCPHATCYERKAAIWAARRLALAVAAMGIPAAPGELSYGEYAVLVNVPHPDQVVEKRCPNLRLRWTGDDRTTTTRVRVAEYPDVEVICLHGKDGRCKCGSAAKAAVTRADPDIQELKATQKRIQAEIVEPAWRAVLAGLESGHVGVWMDLATAAVYNLRVGDEEKGIEAIRVALAKGLAKRQLHVRDDSDFGQMKQAYEALLKNMGLAVPWDVPPEESLRRRYEKIAGWMRDESWWKWDYETNLEAIAGNRANLAALASEAAALGEGAGDLPLLIEELAVQLRELEPVAGEINARRAKEGCWWKDKMPRVICRELLQEEPGSLVWDKTLSQAAPIHLRYALVFAQGLERINALYDRLRQLGALVEAEPLPAL